MPFGIPFLVFAELKSYTVKVLQSKSVISRHSSDDLAACFETTPAFLSSLLTDLLIDGTSVWQGSSQNFSSAENVFLNSRIANVVFLSSPLPFPLFFLACCQHRPHNESVTASLLAEDKGRSKVKPAVPGTLFFALWFLSPFVGYGHNLYYLAIAKYLDIGKEALTGLASCGSEALTTSASFCHDHQFWVTFQEDNRCVRSKRLGNKSDDSYVDRWFIRDTFTSS